jgi:sec-independent protein translocase protein TatB
MYSDTTITGEHVCCGTVVHSPTGRSTTRSRAPTLVGGFADGRRPVFDSIGWGEIVVLALAALFIFGPERLPTLAKDAAQGLKKVREAITGVRAQMQDSMGDEFAELRDLDLRKYHPKTFIREQLLGEDEPPPVRRGSGTGSAGLLDDGVGGTVAGAAATARSRDAGTPPPFDPDAT